VIRIRHPEKSFADFIKIKTLIKLPSPVDIHALTLTGQVRQRRPTDQPEWNRPSLFIQMNVDPRRVPGPAEAFAPVSAFLVPETVIVSFFRSFHPVYGVQCVKTYCVGHHGHKQQAQGSCSCQAVFLCLGLHPG